MRNDEVSRCLDYIRFTSELEGFSLSDGDEEILRDILNGDASAEGAIRAYIDNNGLDTNYEAVEDEQSLYEGTKCLVNYFNIKNREVLRAAERYFVNVRTAELFANPLKMHLSFSYLQAIHSNLFGDIYPSAGEITNTQASKSKEFCHPSQIMKMAEEIFQKLSNDNFLKNQNDRDDFINDLAFYMGESEALHPFREGNGRVIRFFFYELIKQAGHDVDWSEADPDRMLEGSIAAIDGDYQPLVDVFEEILLD